MSGFWAKQVLPSIVALIPVIQCYIGNRHMCYSLAWWVRPLETTVTTALVMLIIGLLSLYDPTAVVQKSANSTGWLHLLRSSLTHPFHMHLFLLSSVTLATYISVPPLLGGFAPWELQ
eukprot:476294-Heterocapsa_arctica.AAC.1